MFAEPDFQRVRTALVGDTEPDRVPIMELLVDPEIREIFLSLDSSTDVTKRTLWKAPTDDPQDKQVQFWYEAGYDYVRVITRIIFPDTLLTTNDTSTALNRGTRGWRDESKGIISSWDDFENYAWPKIEDVSFANVERSLEIMPEGMKVIPVCSGVFENTSWLMGLQAFSLAVMDQPDLVEAMFEKVGSFLLNVFESLSQIDGVGAIWLADDLGCNSGTLISPDMIRKYVFPWHKQIAEKAHNQDLPLILHSCGNLRTIFDDLIDDVKIDALHSLQPNVYGIGELKAKIGGRIALLGNLDVDLLSTGSPDDIRSSVRSILKAAAPGGHFALSSSNSITNYTKIENYCAMLDEVSKSGIYPIH